MSKQAISIDATKESGDPFKFLLDVTSLYGDAVQYSSSLGTTYLLNHPAYIRPVLQSPQFNRTSMVKIVLGEGILSSDGEYWRQQRKLSLPFFNRDAITRIQPIVAARTQVMLERWEKIATNGDSLDVSTEITQLTLAIIVDALFGVKPRSGLRELGATLDILLNVLGDMGCTAFNAPLTFTSAGREEFQTALATLDRIVAEIIDERRSVASDPDNFLSHLLTLRDVDTGKHLTDEQIRDEVVTMLIAGHETTALNLSWAWALLAENPEAEVGLHQELDRVLGARTPNLQDLEALPYSLMILRESMRLCPPVWSIARKSVYAGDIGSCYIPDNVLVIVSPYAVHRHPEFWRNAESFDPLRFAAGEQQQKFSYIPFGGGHHLCLGMNVALMEGHLILASIAQKYCIRPLPKTRIEKQAAVTMRLRNGLQATLTKRVPE